MSDLNRDDLSRNDMDRNNRRPGGLSSGLMMLIAGVAVLALLFMWAPWSTSRVADNNGPGTTVGSSTARPSTSIVPNSAPAPTTPAAPSRHVELVPRRNPPAEAGRVPLPAMEVGLHV